MTTNYTTAQGVQQFSITIASGQTTGTATINAVGSGAFIRRGGDNPSVSADPEESNSYLQLTNSTTVTATRAVGTTGTIVVTGSVTDGDTTNLINSVQQGTQTMIVGNTTSTSTISAVTNANAVLHYLGTAAGDATVAIDQELLRLSLAGTTVTATRAQGGGNQTLTYAWQVTEYKGTCMTANGVQNVSASSSSSVTSFTGSLTAVVMANSVTTYSGHTIATVGTNMSSSLMNCQLTATTTLTVNVNTASANAKVFNAAIQEFNSGVLNSSVQRGTVTLTGATSNTMTLSPAINASYGAVSWLGNTASVTTAVEDQAFGNATLTNGSTITVNKTTATGNITASVEGYEFVAYSSGGTPGSAGVAFTFIS